MTTCHLRRGSADRWVRGLSRGMLTARRRATPTPARGRRSQADARQAVVEREEAGLRLAEELSEDRLLVARETLELSVKRQAERRHVLERRPAGRRTPAECKELAVLHRNEACLRSLRGFDAVAEAEDERGRRRLHE